jgi:hypothetical protein
MVEKIKGYFLIFFRKSYYQMVKNLGIVFEPVLKEKQGFISKNPKIVVPHLGVAQQFWRLLSFRMLFCEDDVTL